MLTARGAFGPGLLAASCLLAAPPSGADVRLSKGVSASATFTDNADGAVSGDAARAETVLGLAPFVALTASGQRHELTFDGRLELTRFVDEDRTTVDPDASVQTRSILVDRLVTLETVARVSQRAADGNPLTDDDFRLNGDREETWELGIAPSLESELGDRSRIRGEYRFATVRSSDEERIGSDTHAIASRLDTVLTRSGAFAFVGTDSAQVRFEDGTSGRTASIGLGAGRPFGRTVVGAVTAGRDWARAGGASETLEDTFWAVALRWEPNERVLATLGYGERVFGRRPSASLLLTGRRSSVEFRWSREISLAGEGLRGDTFSAPFDEGDVDVPLAEREDGVIDRDEALSPFAEDASRVRERVDVGYALTGRRSRLSASVGWFDDEPLGGADTGADAGDGAGAAPIGPGTGNRGSEVVLGFDRALSNRVDVSSRYRFLTTRTDGVEGRVRTQLVELVASVRF